MGFRRSGSKVVPESAHEDVMGAAASLVGDHSHVVTGTTEYFTDAVPFVWSSPIWFPAMVGAATASLAELRMHLPDPRTNVTARQGLAGIAAVIGTYVTAALVRSAPTVPGTTLIIAMAVITWCVLGDKPSVVCGVLAAIVGPIVEIVLVKVGVFAYHDAADGLFGVGPWLPPLYFAFGVVVALLGEIAAKDRLHATIRTGQSSDGVLARPLSVRTSDPGRECEVDDDHAAQLGHTEAIERRRVDVQRSLRRSARERTPKLRRDTGRAEVGGRTTGRTGYAKNTLSAQPASPVLWARSCPARHCVAVPADTTGLYLTRFPCRLAVHRTLPGYCSLTGEVPTYGQDSESFTTPKSISVVVVKLAPGAGVELHTVQLRSLICIRPCPVRSIELLKKTAPLDVDWIASCAPCRSVPIKLGIGHDSARAGDASPTAALPKTRTPAPINAADLFFTATPFGDRIWTIFTN